MIREAATARLPWWGLLALATAAFTDVMTDLLPAGLLPQMSGAAGAADADVATSMQTTVYNVGIAAGSLLGGLILGSAGAGALP